MDPGEEFRAKGERRYSIQEGMAGWLEGIWG